MGAAQPGSAGTRKYTVEMILSSGSPAWPGTAPWVLAAGAMLAYLLATLPSRRATDGDARGAEAAAGAADGGAGWLAVALMAGWALHLGLLILDIGGWGQNAHGARLGFARLDEGHDDVRARDRAVLEAHVAVDEAGAL